jgi:hypothetical protein
MKQSTKTYLFHIIPVCDDAVFDGVFQGKDTSFTLGFVANIRILLSCANHHTFMARTTDDGGKIALGASSPTYESFCPVPTITPSWRGRPTTEGKIALGASSPAKPALHIPVHYG